VTPTSGLVTAVAPRRYASPLATRAVLSPNYTSGRYPEIEYVTHHTVVGSKESALAAFSSRTRQASSSYVIGLDGEVILVVPEWHSPWTNGTWTDPASNGTAVTMEMVDDGDPWNTVRTPAQYRSAALLTADVCSFYGIAKDRVFIRRHRESDGGMATDCCAGFDIDRVVRIVTGQEPLPQGEFTVGQYEDIMAGLDRIDSQQRNCAGSEVAYLWSKLLNQQHLWWVGADGDLYHASFDGSWHQEVVTSGLAPRAQVTATEVDDLQQLQLAARGADGRVCHAWGRTDVWTGWNVEWFGEPDGAPPVPGIDVDKLAQAIVERLPGAEPSADEIVAAFLVALNLQPAI
jgi:N-acetylmuramoyl-L-alanine amidase-like protein